jgi:hypothetical protein
VSGNRLACIGFVVSLGFAQTAVAGESEDGWACTDATASPPPTFQTWMCTELAYPSPLVCSYEWEDDKLDLKTCWAVSAGEEPAPDPVPPPLDCWASEISVDIPNAGVQPPVVPGYTCFDVKAYKQL